MEISEEADARCVIMVHDRYDYIWSVDPVGSEPWDRVDDADYIWKEFEAGDEVGFGQVLVELSLPASGGWQPGDPAGPALAAGEYVAMWTVHETHADDCDCCDCEGDEDDGAEVDDEDDDVHLSAPVGAVCGNGGA